MSYDPENVSNTEDGSKIKVHRVDGGDDRDRDDLFTCYFERVGDLGEYGLFESEDNHSIPTSPALLRSGSDFLFIRGGVLWTVTNFHINPERARGNWINTRTAENDDGSFQAQAGPTFEDEESVSSASA